VKDQEEMPSRSIAVVDGNSLMHRAFHALPETMTAPDGRPTNAAYGFLSMLVKLIADLRPDAVIVAFDHGKPAFRMEALAQYKIHRPPTPQSLRDQFPMVKGVLAALDIPVVQLDGWEGDDILGTIARLGSCSDARVLLVTGDRDAFQLVDERVSVVTTRKGITDIVEYGPAEVEERYGITPAQVTDYLGLKGDTSDNIPGVPGVGEKTAAKLLQQYGTLDAVLEAAAAGEIAGKVGENLRVHADSARASRVVATIACDVPVELDLDGVRFGGFEPAEVARVFAELRFTSLLDRVVALATRPVDEPSSAEVTAGRADVADCGPCVRDTDADALLDRWSTMGEGWIGVAFGESGDTLFAEHPDVAFAGPGGVALYEADRGDRTLAGAFDGSRLAAIDVKALVQHLCPPDGARPCDERALRVDPARLFDVAVAAYLLESGRSSYELVGLAADYLATVLPEAGEGRPSAAVDAHAVRELAAELEHRLEADDSSRVMRDIEMPLVPVLARMERAGVGIDVGELAALAGETRANIDSLRNEITDLAGCEFSVDSPKQLAEVLFEKMGLPAGKRTKTGYSTDASVLAGLSQVHPIADKIVAYRELTKLMSTYIEALPRLLGEDGRLHTSFNQTVAATGRLSSSSPNLQNIPVRTDFGKRIRAAFVPAAPGDLMVSADYSQIELRILAHLSEDAGLIEAFTGGADFHAATAARVFGVELDGVETWMRARAKAVNFGIVYGQTAHGLADSLKITHAEAQGMIDRYYAAYPRVRDYLDEVVAESHRTGYAETMFGRKRRIPELLSSNYNLRAFGERTAMNHPMQGSAADVMKLAMIEVDRRLRADGFAARMVLQVHDELVFEVAPDELDALSAMVVEAMSGVAELRVPLEVSVASGANWAAAK
jgi:DNA polymerase-1